MQVNCLFCFLGNAKTSGAKSAGLRLCEDSGIGEAIGGVEKTAVGWGWRDKDAVGAFD